MRNPRTLLQIKIIHSKVDYIENKYKFNKHRFLKQFSLLSQHLPVKFAFELLYRKDAILISGDATIKFKLDRLNEIKSSLNNEILSAF